MTDTMFFLISIADHVHLLGDFSISFAAQIWPKISGKIIPKLEVWCQHDEASWGQAFPWRSQPQKKIAKDGGVAMEIFFPRLKVLGVFGSIQKIVPRLCWDRNPDVWTTFRGICGKLHGFFGKVKCGKEWCVVFFPMIWQYWQASKAG